MFYKHNLGRPHFSGSEYALASERLDSGTEHFGSSTLAITSVDVANAASRVIPEKAATRCNIRFNNLHSADRQKTGARMRCDETIADMGGHAELALFSNTASFLTEPGLFTEFATHVVCSVTGQAATPDTGGGASDAGFIGNYCPVVEFGPVNKTIHQVDERIALDDLTLLVKVYRRILGTRLCSVKI
ncbi:MAG: M20/M25/M40 family metallo-hydrolase [Hyphomicrobiales bacterium]